MTSARVLVVDDSSVMRKLLSDVLSDEPDLLVVGTANNGQAALSKIETTHPDLITMDVEMPGMNGLDLLVEVRARWPKVPVIMISSLTQKAAATTLEALARGATDYVTKPANSKNLQESIAYLKAELVPKARILARSHATSLRVKDRSASVSRISTVRRAARLDALAIGASTGGPDALATVFRELPGDISIPIFVVQHMPPIFTRLLAERLDNLSAVKVYEAIDGQEVLPGCAYLAPGDHHLTLRKADGKVFVSLNKNPPENSCRPSVDVLFWSVKEIYGEHSLAVILTGMGKDGLSGSEKIREAQGVVIAQDEDTSVVWGMPGFVAKAGLADSIVPLHRVCHEVLRYLGHSLGGMSKAPQRGNPSV